MPISEQEVCFLGLKERWDIDSVMCMLREIRQGVWDI